MKSLPLSVFVCPPQETQHHCSIRHWPPSSPHHSSYDAIRGEACSCPTLLLGLHRRVCFLQAQSWLQTRLQLNGEFPLCASCISITDFGVIFKAFVFVLHSVHNPSPVCSSHLCLTKVWIDYAVLDFASGSVCALSWISHCPSQLLNRSELFW